MKVVVPVSGGIDSTVLLALALSEGHTVYPLFLDLGQRARRWEYGAVRQTVRWYHLDVKRLRFRDFGRMLGLPSLRPQSYDEAFVPDRDTLVASVATAYAMTLDAEQVWHGTVGSDAYGTTDADYLIALGNTIRIGNRGWNPPRHLAPFLFWKKPDVITVGQKIGAPFHLTWTCWDNVRPVCGACPKCASRSEAFRRAGAEDPLAPGKTSPNVWWGY